MSDLGFKVSLDGIDVSTKDPTKLAYTSVNSAFKIYKSIADSVIFSNYSTTITIPHDLGYVPIVMGYYTPYNNDKTKWCPANTLWEYPYDVEFKLTSSIDKINIYISSPVATSITAFYKIFILSERAL